MSQTICETGLEFTIANERMNRPGSRQKWASGTGVPRSDGQWPTKRMNRLGSDKIIWSSYCRVKLSLVEVLSVSQRLTGNEVVVESQEVVEEEKQCHD